MIFFVRGFLRNGLPFSIHRSDLSGLGRVSPRYGVMVIHAGAGCPFLCGRGTCVFMGQTSFVLYHQLWVVVGGNYGGGPFMGLGVWGFGTEYGRRRTDVLLLVAVRS